MTSLPPHKRKPAFKDPEAPPAMNMLTGVHTRGYLPHFKGEGRTYFLTFRLADSLPHATLDRIMEEREIMLKRLSESSGRNAELATVEVERIKALFNQRVEEYLDTGHGACWLRRSDIAKICADAIRHFANQRYCLYSWVIMPNHVHAILKPLEEFSLSFILKNMKGYTSRMANRTLGKTGNNFWLAESYDHWIRDVGEFSRLMCYVENNPVKAGLCDKPEDWMWGSAWDRAKKLGEYLALTPDE